MYYVFHVYGKYIKINRLACQLYTLKAPNQLSGCASGSTWCFPATVNEYVVTCGANKILWRSQASVWVSALSPLKREVNLPSMSLTYLAVGAFVKETQRCGGYLDLKPMKIKPCLLNAVQFSTVGLNGKSPQPNFLAIKSKSVYFTHDKRTSFQQSEKVQYLITDLCHYSG